VNRSEARVSSPDAVSAILFQVRQEPRDEWRVEVREIEVGGRFSKMCLSESEEKSERVSIRRHGVPARSSLIE
jgi:hypothetical protein